MSFLGGPMKPKAASSVHVSNNNGMALWVALGVSTIWNSYAACETFQLLA